MIGPQDSSMNYTTIMISSNRINTVQRDLLVKIGFNISGNSLSKSIKTDLLYTVIQQIVAQNIPFTLKTNAPLYNQTPCNGCRR